MPTLENFGIALGPLRQKDWDLAKERDALQNRKKQRGIFCEKCGHFQSVLLPADDEDGRGGTKTHPGGCGLSLQRNEGQKKMRRRSHRGRFTRKIPRMLLGNVLCVLRSEIPEFWEDERLRSAVLL